MVRGEQEQLRGSALGEDVPGAEGQDVRAGRRRVDECVEGGAQQSFEAFGSRGYARGEPGVRAAARALVPSCAMRWTVPLQRDRVSDQRLGAA